MAMNALARCGCFKLLFLMYFGVMMLVGAGCKPVFEDTACQSDSDCFSDQYCSVSKTCLIKSATRLKISSFESSMPSAPAGSSVTFSWETQGGTAAFIEGPDDFLYAVPSASLTEGSVEVTLPDMPGAADYTFVLTWDDLEKREGLTVTVEEPVTPTLPVIESFEADVDQIDPGALVNLSWQVTDASEGEISADGTVIHTLAASELARGSFQVTPTDTTTFELSVQNDGGEDSSSVTVNVNALPRPTITSFTVSSTDILLGESITLAWEIEDATSISIRDASDLTVFESADAAVVAMGTFELSPVEETSYTLTAYNLQGDTSASTMTVLVKSLPTINSFTSSKVDEVVPGEMLTLSWDVTGADTIEIRDQDDAIVAQSMDDTGTATVTTSSSTTSYTLVATNGAGNESASIDIALLGAPTIVSFTASKQTDLLFDESITLSWEVTDAASIEIRDESNAVLHTSSMASGDFMLNVQADDTYTLVAINPAANASQELSVTLLKVPVINAFTASQTTDVTPGQDVDFSWDVTGADTITISAGASVLHTSSDAAGTVTLAIPASAVYTLTATNAAGSISRDVDIDVLIVPVITSFDADVVSVPSGGAVTLSWSTQDTVSLQLLDDQGSAPIVIAMQDIASGSIVLRPQVSTTYTLRAQGQGGAMNFVTQQLSITVTAASLLITEVLFAPDAPVMGRQWVELYNAGDTFVDLSNYSLAWSGLSSFADFRQALDPILLAPGETYVIGDVSDVGNYAPIVQQQSGFSPALGDGMTGADGVALFFLEAQNVTASSLPVDSVLWGTSNTKMLLAEDGGVDMEVTPLPSAGSSIVRVSATSDIFVDAQGGFPNTPIFVTQVAPSTVPNTATQGSILIDGFGFDPLLDTYLLGTTPLNCAATTTGLDCQLDLSTPSTDSGSVSFTARRINTYVQDAQGNAVLMPRAMPLDYVRPDSIFFEELLLDTSADFECATKAPLVDTAPAGTPLDVEVEIYALGFTDTLPGLLPPGAILQVGLFDPATPPFEQVDVMWQTWDMSTDSSMDAVDPNNEVFSKQVSSPAAATLDAVFRFSQDGGTSWIYCNAESAGGSQAGWVSGVSLEWTN